MSKHAEGGDHSSASMAVALHRTYSAYGAHDTKAAARTAFAGQRCEADTGWYVLGERPYSPTLRRFLAPDRLSPFASGDINRYTYCSGDPINRIDPSGSTWLGLFGTLKKNARIHGVSGAASVDGSIDAAGTTPGTLATAVATIVDVASITAAVLPASMTAAPPRARGLFGRMENETRGASEGSALPPAKKRKSRRAMLDEDNNLVRNRPSEKVQDGITILMNTRIPSSRFGAREFGWPYVMPRWSERIHRTNPNSMILASDSVTYALEYGSLMRRLQELEVKRFTHYTGSHGGLIGENWDIESQLNVSPDREMFERDKAYMERASIEFGMAISVVDIGGWTIEQFRDAIAGNGVHSLAKCFGLVDPVVRREFNLPTVTVYHLYLGPAP